MTKVIGEYRDRDVSLLAKDQYVRQVRWAVPLSLEEEQALLARVGRGTAVDGSLSADASAARDRLVESYQGLLLHLAGQCRYRAESMDTFDLAQEGYFGLVLALERYAGRVSVPAFHAIAGKCMVQAMADAIDKRDRMVRLAGSTPDVLNKARKVRSRLERHSGQEPTVGQLAAAMGMLESELAEYVGFEQRSRVGSLEAVFACLQEGAEEDMLLVSVFASGSGEEQAERGGQLRQAIMAAVAALTPRTRQAIELHFGLWEEGLCLTPEEVGQRLNMALTTAKCNIVRGKVQLRRALASQVEEVA